jgi:hypothetical protein
MVSYQTDDEIKWIINATSPKSHKQKRPNFEKLNINMNSPYLQVLGWA